MALLHLLELIALQRFKTLIVAGLWENEGLLILVDGFPVPLSDFYSRLTASSVSVCLWSDDAREPHPAGEAWGWWSLLCISRSAVQWTRIQSAAAQLLNNISHRFNMLLHRKINTTFAKTFIKRYHKTIGHFRSHQQKILAVKRTSKDFRNI